MITLRSPKEPQIFVRVPITGHTITGHDLAITNLSISGTLNPGEEATINGIVENVGSFDEDSVLASLYVNWNYVKSASFPGLNSGENQEIEINWIVSPPAVYFLEVEIEPIPGKENAMKVTKVKTYLYHAHFNWLLVKLETDEGIEGWG